MVKEGQRIDAAATAYTNLAGTRTNVLERSLHKIDALRSPNAELPEPDADPEDEQTPLALEA